MQQDMYYTYVNQLLVLAYKMLRKFVNNKPVGNMCFLAMSQYKYYILWLCCRNKYDCTGFIHMYIVSQIEDLRVTSFARNPFILQKSDTIFIYAFVTFLK